MPNLELLRLVLRTIDKFPWRYSQERYVSVGLDGCGTAYCVAGWVWVLSGFELINPNGLNYDWLYPPMTWADGIHSQARELLGISHDEAGRLFYGGNSRQMVEDIAEEIARKAGEPLWATEEIPLYSAPIPSEGCFVAEPVCV